MSYRTIALLPFVAGLATATAFGFSSDGSTLTRSFDRTVARTNAAIQVTVNVSNRGTNTWRGFWYSDQLPSGLAVTNLSVTLGGRVVTNCLFESGQDGDVWPGCTPYRWVLETPPALAQTNPVPPQSALQIVFTLGSATPGAFNLPQFQFIGYDPSPTNAVFGYLDSTNQDAVTFISTSAPPASVGGQLTTNGYQVNIAGLAGASYAVLVSTNLIQWLSLATNASPYGFTDTNSASLPRRFYRSQWQP